MALTSKGLIAISSTSTGTQVIFKPKQCTPSFDSLATADSGRSDDGYMHIEWVYRNVRKLEIVMPPLPNDEMSILLQLVQGKEYYIEYFDIYDNDYKKIHVYTSNSKADFYSGVLEWHGNTGLWIDCSFNAIELGGDS